MTQTFHSGYTDDKKKKKRAHEKMFNIIRHQEIQNKTLMKYHYISIPMVKLKSD